MNKRVYCLYRVSTTGQVEKDDIPMQKQACREFAALQGWTIVKEIYEKGISGFKVSSKDREAIQEIRKATIEKRYDVLLVFMFDRLGRREDETPFLIQELIENGAEVWSVRDGQQRIESHEDKLMLYLRSWASSGESLKTGIRVKTRMGQLVQEGRYKGGTPPYGYKLVKKGRLNKKQQEIHDIEVEPEEAETVRRVFNKYVYEGYGAYRIIQFLNEQGIKNHNGNIFNSSSIRNMLKCLMYIGIMTSGETQSDVIPELVIEDKEIFDRAQVIRKDRTNNYEDQRKTPMNTKGQSLLAGNLFCGHCGGRLTLTTSGKSYTRKDGTVVKNRRVRYACYNKSRKLCACDGQTGYTMHKLDGIVSELLIQMFSNIQGLPENELIEKQYKNDVKFNAGKVSRLEREIKKQSSSLKTLQDEVVKAIQGTADSTPKF